VLLTGLLFIAKLSIKNILEKISKNKQKILRGNLNGKIHELDGTLYCSYSI
jgi:hypothetical protein